MALVSIRHCSPPRAERAPPHGRRGWGQVSTFRDLSNPNSSAKGRVNPGAFLALAKLLQIAPEKQYMYSPADRIGLNESASCLNMYNEQYLKFFKGRFPKLTFMKWIVLTFQLLRMVLA